MFFEPSAARQTSGVVQAVTAKNQSGAPHFGRTVWRKCACGGSEEECDDCKAGVVRRFASSAHGGGLAPPSVRAALQSPGMRLDSETRSYMESSFGHDFGSVRIHADEPAAKSARDISSLAYAVGSHVVFASGRYAPRTASGRALLAHELAHVAGQRSDGSALPERLEVGAHTDRAEHDADRKASAALTGSLAASSGGAKAAPVVRRQPQDVPLRVPTTQELPGLIANAALNPDRGPQRVGESRRAVLGPEKRGEDTVDRYAIRKITKKCPCRLVPDSSSGVYANTNLDNLAIAYRWCRGSKSITIFAKSQSNLNNAIQSFTLPSGTVDIGASGGFDAGKGHVTVEGGGRATNDQKTGVGGFAGVTYESSGNGVKASLSLDYLRRLGQQAGRDPNDITARFQFDLGKDFNIGAEGGREGGGWKGGITFGGHLDPQPEHLSCYTCMCPPPAREYECIDIVEDREVPITVPTVKENEYRYYFTLDKTVQAEDRDLRAFSDAEMDRLASDVAGGAEVTIVTAYASPEAKEATHNKQLSEDRAQALGRIVGAKLPSGTSVPAPYGGYELLGSEPTPEVTSRLRDLAPTYFGLSAEDLTIFLTGKEIENRDLSKEFLGLFKAMTDRHDRLTLFGLANADSKVQDDLIRSIDEFVRSGGRGARPWENVFRRLRFGIVRTIKRGTMPSTETKAGRVELVTGDACDKRAKDAESRHLFGDVEKNEVSQCESDPSKQPAEQPGCDYDPSKSDPSTLAPPPPSYAPTQLWPSTQQKQQTQQ